MSLFDIVVNNGYLRMYEPVKVDGEGTTGPVQVDQRVADRVSVVGLRIQYLADCLLKKSWDHNIAVSRLADDDSDAISIDDLKEQCKEETDGYLKELIFQMQKCFPDAWDSAREAVCRKNTQLESAEDFDEAQLESSEDFDETPFDSKIEILLKQPLDKRIEFVQKYFGIVAENLGGDQLLGIKSESSDDDISHSDPAI